MKFPLPASAALMLALAPPIPAAVSRDAVVLNDHPAVALAGRYLYFDHSPGSRFLADGYYPGETGPASLLSPEPEHAPGPAGIWIPFQSGALTDGNPATYVSGWTGRTRWQAADRNDGPYILFDLGQAYNLTRVEVRLKDHSGRRWYAGADHPQRLWTAAVLSAEPGRGEPIDATSFYWNQQYTFTAFKSDTTAVYPVTLDPTRPTRYVLLMLRAGVVDGRNAGGIINDVIFHAAEPPKNAPDIQ